MQTRTQILQRSRKLAEFHTLIKGSSLPEIFFLIPSIPAVLGNFLVPMMIGAKISPSRASTC